MSLSQVLQALLQLPPHRRGSRELRQLAELYGLELPSLQTELSRRLLDRLPGSLRAPAGELFLTLHHLLQEDPPSVSSTTATAGDALVLLLSDLHIGKLTTAGTHAFNLVRAEARLRSLAGQIVNLQRQLTPSPTELVCLCLGDIVDGACIHDRQAYRLEFDPHLQVVHASRLLWQLLYGLSAHFERLRLFGVRGNHGRTHQLAPVEANWDLLVYLNLRLMWLTAVERGDERVQRWEIAYTVEEFGQVEISGWRFHCRHIAPVQVETPAASNRLHGYRDLTSYDVLCAGHFHHLSIGYHQDRPVILNGCLPGVDDLAQRLGKYSRPAQMCLLTRRGVTPVFAYFPLYLEEEDG